MVVITTLCNYMKTVQRRELGTRQTQKDGHETSSATNTTHKLTPRCAASASATPSTSRPAAA